MDKSQISKLVDIITNYENCKDTSKKVNVLTFDNPYSSNYDFNYFCTLSIDESFVDAVTELHENNIDWVPDYSKLDIKAKIYTFSDYKITSDLYPMECGIYASMDGFGGDIMSGFTATDYSTNDSISPSDISDVTKDFIINIFVQSELVEILVYDGNELQLNFTFDITDMKKMLPLTPPQNLQEEEEEIASVKVV